MSFYYSYKKKAFAIIDKMLTDGEPIEKIYYKIETMFGFGEKFVDKRIERIKEFAKLMKDVP